MHTRSRFLVAIRDTVLELIEFSLAILILVAVFAFSFSSLREFLVKDWSSMAVMYEFISLVLLILLGIELVRLVLVHSVTIVMELMLLIIARSMLYPETSPLELLYCAIAFSFVVGIYYLYELKPLKNLEDLTK